MFAVVIAAGSIAGACVAMSVVAGFVIDHLPFAKADEYHAFKGDITVQVGQLKGSVGTIFLNQKETLELQLLDRVQKLDDRILKLPSGSEDLAETRRERAEKNQRLRAVQEEIRRLSQTDAQ